MTNVMTIGFTQKSAKDFFGLLTQANVQNVLDVRLNNVSQLAGFAKKGDLQFLLKEVAGIGYLEVKDLAPSKSILSQYQKGSMDWARYEQEYISEISRRRVEHLLDKTIFDHGCLLCSEHHPHECHRRLAAEYLNSCWGGTLQIRHLY